MIQRLGAERQRVRALIERAGVAMLMNIDEHDTHVGRPMLPLFIQNDPHIFFLTHQSSRKVMQLVTRPKVGLTIISANCYLVIAGSAHISRDPELIRRCGVRRIVRGFPTAKPIARPARFASRSNGSTTGNRRPAGSSGLSRPSMPL
jgi:hypothetical protein